MQSRQFSFHIANIYVYTREWDADIMSLEIHEILHHNTVIIVWFATIRFLNQNKNIN